MASKINLTKILQAIDLKDRSYYDQLSTEEQKAFSGYVLLRYASSLKDTDPNLVEYYIRSANIQANKHLFELSKHPKLQWLMLTTISPNFGKFFHPWFKPQKKGCDNKEIKKKLLNLYSTMKEADIDVWSQLITEEELKELLNEYGQE